MAKEAYMTVAVPGTKKVSICSRRIGTRDRMTVIAMAISEQHAEKIVDALNALQGRIDQIDAPSRLSLEISQGIAVSLQRKISEDGEKYRRERAELHDKVRRLENDKHQADNEIRRLHLEVLAAQKTAREVG